MKRELGERVAAQLEPKPMLGKRVAALSWSQLSPLAARWSAPPGEAGPTSAQSRLRLFGAKESDVRVTLYRDNHAWCASATRSSA